MSFRFDCQSDFIYFQRKHTKEKVRADSVFVEAGTGSFPFSSHGSGSRTVRFANGSHRTSDSGSPEVVLSDIGQYRVTFDHIRSS